jgi:hypothetical protein
MAQIMPQECPHRLIGFSAQGQPSTGSYSTRDQVSSGLDKLGGLRPKIFLEDFAALIVAVDNKADDSLGNSRDDNRPTRTDCHNKPCCHSRCCCYPNSCPSPNRPAAGAATNCGANGNTYTER